MELEPSLYGAWSQQFASPLGEGNLLSLIDKANKKQFLALTKNSSWCEITFRIARHHQRLRVTGNVLQGKFSGIM